eukprot:scaffold15228_cov61-Phaeocystis_antarctica.AAC.1
MASVSPIAHLDTVLRNLLSHPRLPRRRRGARRANTRTGTRLQRQSTRGGSHVGLVGRSCCFIFSPHATGHPTHAHHGLVLVGRDPAVVGEARLPPHDRHDAEGEERGHREVECDAARRPQRIGRHLGTRQAPDHLGRTTARAHGGDAAVGEQHLHAGLCVEAGADLAVAQRARAAHVLHEELQLLGELRGVHRRVAAELRRGGVQVEHEVPAEAEDVAHVDRAARHLQRALDLVLDLPPHEDLVAVELRGAQPQLEARAALEQAGQRQRRARRAVRRELLGAGQAERPDAEGAARRGAAQREGLVARARHVRRQLHPALLARHAGAARRGAAGASELGPGDGEGGGARGHDGGWQSHLPEGVRQHEAAARAGGRLAVVVVRDEPELRDGEGLEAADRGRALGAALDDRGPVGSGVAHLAPLHRQVGVAAAARPQRRQREGDRVAVGRLDRARRGGGALRRAAPRDRGGGEPVREAAGAALVARAHLDVVGGAAAQAFERRRRARPQLELLEAILRRVAPPVGDCVAAHREAVVDRRLPRELEGVARGAAQR